MGSTIKELAADDATVVVGTAIDPEMHNEIRVTIVATGIGQGVPAKQGSAKEKEAAIPPFKLVQRQHDSEAHLRHDRPSVRQKPVGDMASERERADELEYLDIPAFLRRQAD